jgi:hypothetical protein
VALDYVTANEKEFGSADKYDKAEENATIILTVAVLSIILTAPTFAVAMKYCGENWLVKETNWKDGKMITPDEEADFYEGDVELTVNMGHRKESLSASLGHRKLSFQVDPHHPNAPRKLSIQHTEVTPRGVAPRNRSQSNPATLAAMGLGNRGPTEIPRPEFGPNGTI